MTEEAPESRGWFRSRSYANVTSTLALVIALGGTSFAAAALAKNSVGTKQLKNSAVTAAKVHGSAVTGSKVKDGSLLAKDLKTGQLIMPVAYAHVAADGTVDAANSKGVTSANVQLESAAAFCFTGLSFPVRRAVVTEDYADLNGVAGEAAFAVGNPQDDCSEAGTQAEVATTAQATYQATGFYIFFY
jgi:hypothetical protein